MSSEPVSITAPHASYSNRTSMLVHICMHVCMHMYACVCACVHMYVCMLVTVKKYTIQGNI